MNSSRSLLSSPLFPTSSPNFRSSASSPSPSRTSVPMTHDNAGRASTECHYSPSLVAATEEQAAVHGSLKGDKALLEFLLDMALEQHTEGKGLSGEEGAEGEFQSYLRDLQRQVIYQQAFGEKDDSISVSSNSMSIPTLKPVASLGLGAATSATATKDVAFVAEESGASAASNHPYEKLLWPPPAPSRRAPRRPPPPAPARGSLFEGRASSRKTCRRNKKNAAVARPHPDEAFTGFCAACLRERLAGLEASAAAASAPGRKSTSAIRSLFARPFAAGSSSTAGNPRFCTLAGKPLPAGAR